MPDGTDAMKMIPADVAIDFMKRAFMAVGMPEDGAATTATRMADSDLMGKDSHGIFRLPGYIGRIKAGGINLNPDIRIARETGSTALVDGDNGMGHIIVNRMAEIAIEKAKTQGVAWVGVYNSNHAGAAAAYSNLAMAHDMIGIYAAVGSANHLPPWGGTEMLLSTNPISISVPAGDEKPIVLDMATTVSSFGKIKVMAQRGQMMPEGFMIDREGKPLLDPKRAEEGFLLPIGGAKGYGLALMIGILAGTLNGAAFGKDVVDMNHDPTTPTNTGQFYCAIDIKAFGDVTAFRCQVDDVIGQMHGSPTMPGFDRVRVPGEGSMSAIDKRSVSGIPIPPQLMKLLDGVAGDLGIVGLS
ncbi:MAG: Ldh family oxidoreductase [Alphaproteobacteria bacterium]|jgi:L-2-hydroxycarboxylate dehydrogenase (NAD+)